MTDDDKTLGTATSGSTSKSFGTAAGSDSPSGVMTLFENSLLKMTKPVPLAQAESTALKLLPLPSTNQESAEEKSLVNKMQNYVNPQGEIDRGGLVRYAADTFNQLPQFKPDEKLLKQASDMLVHLGIEDDKDHSMAAGVARASMAGSQGLQALEKRGELIMQAGLGRSDTKAVLKRYVDSAPR